MLIRHIVLLIAIRPSDGDVKPGALLGAFREEKAISRHRVSPSPFLPYIIIPHNTITLQKQLHLHSPQLSPVHYTDTHPTRNVVCPSGAWFENRPYLTPYTRVSWNPKRVMVQWVGIGTHTHTHLFLNFSLSYVENSSRITPNFFPLLYLWWRDGQAGLALFFVFL